MPYRQPRKHRDGDRRNAFCDCGHMCHLDFPALCACPDDAQCGECGL